MSETLPVVYLARHGETAWTISRLPRDRPTSPPIPSGQGGRPARTAARRIRCLGGAQSPLTRAIGEGRIASAADIEAISRSGAPGRTKVAPARKAPPSVRTGSSSATVARNGSRPSGSALGPTGRYAECGPSTATRSLSSGHFLEFAARLRRLPPGAGRYFLLGTASLSAMGYEHDRSDPVIRFWDEMPDERRVSPAPAYSRRGKVRR